MKSLRSFLALAFFVWTSVLFAQDTRPRLIEQPDAFGTLVNPMCSHCREEAKRRASELKADDRVLCWIRGYSEGGVIPHRFFLNPYRVISDTYGVFVYDPDAGYTRGFTASLEFQFHGWRDGVMVMKHKDGTLYSCLSGIAFAGPRMGDKLKAVPTLVSNWGHWLETYPQAVAYHMFDKYQPVDLPTKAHATSLKSRGRADKRLPEETRVFGVAVGEQQRAYTLELLAKEGLVFDEIAGKPMVVLWLETTKTAAAYRPVATPPKIGQGKPRTVSLERDDGKIATAPFRDKETGSHWDIAGRAVDGEMKGWTLEWLDGVEVKWFAWAAEYPGTTLYQQKKEAPAKPAAKDALKEIAGSSEFLRAVPKKFAVLQSVDTAKNAVTLRCEGDLAATTWPLTSDAEVKVHGWWGRLDHIAPRAAQDGQPAADKPRVWAWFKVDRAKIPVAIFMLADDLSEQDIHGDGLKIKSLSDKTIVFTFAKDKSREVRYDECTLTRNGKRASMEDLKPNDSVFLHRYMTIRGYQSDLLDRGAFERLRTAQKNLLRARWSKEGLPGTIGFLHVYSGEVDVLLDHEAMRWGRSLRAGDKVELAATPPIKAVVKSVEAQREKTQVRLVAKTFDLADLQMGQRILFKMPAPAPEVENALMPPDIDQPKAKEERINWFLANTYCVCGIGGDGCTGHFYTLASCNPNGCGAPNATRHYIGKRIDDGWSNREIFDALLKQRGPQMLRPHLLP